jgi:hypothetical protein
MTPTDNIKLQQSQRMGELGKIARQRYLEAGGDPYRGADGNQWLTEEERQEYLRLARQVFDEESISNYIKKHGTWRDSASAHAGLRFAALKAQMKSAQ